MASVICGALLWVTKLQPVPRVDGALIRALLPVAFFHTVGHVSACVSFSLMAISFSHVIKSAEPVRFRSEAALKPCCLPLRCHTNVYRTGA